MWDGAAELREVAESAGAESAVALNVTRYREVTPNGTVALVLSPDRTYTGGETARVRRFVERGGTLVVAEDFGNQSNALLEGIGASARFDGALVRDERFNGRSPAFPVARNVTNASGASDRSVTRGVNALTLNHGTVLEPNGASAVVHTSEFAYLDRNRNGELDANESIGSYPVVSVESVGEGRVVAVSDPSLFINVMLESRGNGRFVRNLFGTEEFVLLDYSHAERVPPLSLALVVLRGTPLLQVLLVGIGLAAVGVWGEGLLGGLKTRLAGEDESAEAPTQSAAELADVLRRRHPEWDEKRIERVVRSLRGN
jgi:hypothetical protein